MKIKITEITLPSTEDEIAERVADQLTEIAASMKEQGQLQPISVRSVNGSYVLNFGEKRVRAAQLIGWTEIEAVIEDVSEKQAHILRCHENLKRFNLPWDEQALLTEKLHILRQEEHGFVPSGRPKRDVEKKGWSVRDTADELGAALGLVSENINLARAVRNNPALRAIKDRKTAIKLVRQEAQRELDRVESTDRKKIDSNEIYLGDATAVLSTFPDHSIDGVITDPPWLNFFDPSLKRDARTFPVFKEMYRVLKYNSISYIFVGMEDYPHYVGWERIEEDGSTFHVKGELEKIGFSVAKTPLIWRKTGSLSRRGVKSWEYDRDFEFIIVAAKGTPVLTSPTRLSGVKSFAAVPPASLIHPNEKPVDLVKDILEDCSHKQNIILDPFAGSGVLGSACLETGRRFILIERERERYEKIVKRLKGE